MMSTPTQSRRTMSPAARKLEAELKRLQRVKQTPADPAQLLGPTMIGFFKESVHKRQNKLAIIAECWERIIPKLLSDHCSIESLNRGTLTVLVDTSSHLYELKQILLAGLQQQLMLACKGAGLRKITLKPGRWYEGDGGDRRVRFEKR
jgi:hypothetical protein